MDVAETTAAIRSMEIRGAVVIARAAATALADHVAHATGDVRRSARDAAAALVAARPTAVALPNAVAAILNDVLAADDPAREATRSLQRFLADLDADEVATVKQGEKAIAAAPRVLTLCHSSQVMAAIVAAHQHTPEVRVVALETRPWNQGHISASHLAKHGVAVTFVVDGAASRYLHDGDVDQVVVGADAVLPGGDLVNKIGTFGVAASAAHAGIPVHCVASAIKFTSRRTVPIEHRDPAEVWADAPDGVRIENPVFDHVPADLVSAYATPWGMLEPEVAWQRRVLQ